MKSIIVSQINSKTLTRETSGADDVAHEGGSDAATSGLVTPQCDRGDCGDGGNAGTIDVDVDVAVA